eukprot:COSAG06_NODE_65104_length_258_cov_0.327044_1_plen_58_part_00
MEWEWGGGLRGVVVDDDGRGVGSFLLLFYLFLVRYRLIVFLIEDSYLDDLEGYPYIL